jgi:ABC-type dipeptide/oligopeptide/nickel transport system permease subunit
MFFVIIVVVICASMVVSAIAGMFAGIFGKKDKDCNKC